MSNTKETYRYKCISRVDKKTVTGKTDYKDRYLYRILDNKIGQVAILNGATLKTEMQKGLKIDGLELTADNRIMLKDLKADRTVITPSAVKVGKVDKNNNQCIDFSLAVYSLCQMYCTVSGVGGLQSLVGADTLRIQNCGYGSIEPTARKAKMLGGIVHTFNNQKFIIIRNGNTVTMLAEKWVYSNKQPKTGYDFHEITTIGGFADALKVKRLEINGIEFLTTSLDSAFAKTNFGWGSAESQLKDILITNSDMSYIEDLNYLCNGLRLDKIEIRGTSLDSVKSMHGAFREPRSSSKIDNNPQFIIDIPKTPNLLNTSYMFEYHSRSCQPDMRFMECAKIRKASGMFSSSSICTLDLSRLDLRELVDASDMFYNCTKVRTINFGKQMLTKLILANNMFRECSEINTLDLMCIDSPGLKRSDRDCLPCSQQQRTQYMFSNINKNAKIRISKKMIGILNENIGKKA